MMRVAALLAAGTAQAETVTCMMDDGRDLAFAIDRTQFAPAQDPNDPPRRKLTTVRYGDMQFPAEPFLIAGTRGFSAEASGGAAAIFVMQPDGAATYAVARSGIKVTGTCEVLQ